jgi:glycosyltransferase involved in cell wall biosynthesis
METKQPVLVIVTPGFPKDEVDSTCLPPQQNLVKAINHNFPSAKIIILSFQYPFAKGEYEWNGNTVIAFGGRNMGKLFRVWLWRSVSQRLKKIQHEYTITGLLSFWCGECAFIAGRFAKGSQLPHYCWLLGQDAKKGNKYVPRIDAKSTHYIVLSDFIDAEFYNNYGIRPAQTIPIGIDTKEFAAEKAERDIDIIAVGSLIPLKRFDIFIEVIAALQKKIPQIRSVLCGEGPEKDKLQHLINSLSLQKNIILAGERPHKEILAMMQLSKVLLHPSAYEGFGMVCLEALAAGCDVISFVQPMKKDIERWHIVKNKEEMIQKSREMLIHDTGAHDPVLPYLADDSAIAVMKLFGYKR